VIEGGEVVVLVLDLGALEDLEAQPDEDVLELAADLGDQVQVTGRERRVAGQRDVDSILLRRRSSSASSSAAPRSAISSSSRTRTELAACPTGPRASGGSSRIERSVAVSSDFRPR